MCVPSNTNNDGDSACACTENVELLSPLLVNTTFTCPVGSASGGVRIFTCPALMKYTYAAFPFTVALTPSSCVGKVVLLGPKSPGCPHIRCVFERFAPLISTHVFGAITGFSPSAFATSEIVGNPLAALDDNLNTVPSPGGDAAPPASVVP